jgi:uncharacterized damage-inducible protein DinB
MDGVAWESAEVRMFWRYISSSLNRLVEVAEGLDQGGLHWKPAAPDTNSVAALVNHMLANAEENLLQVFCGIEGKRTRSAEFVETAEAAAELGSRWASLRPRVENALMGQSSEALDSEVDHPRRGRITGREVLVVVARHSAEHLGQAELTRDLWLADVGSR